MSESPQSSLEGITHKATKDLADAEARAKAALQEVDASIVFAAYSISRLVGMQGDDLGKHGRPAPAAVELAAWLCYPEFGRSAVRDGDRIQAAITAIKEHEAAFSFAEVFSELPPDEQNDDLAMHLRLHSGMVRGSAYPVQIIHRIERVLQPFESELAACVGIGPWRACEIVKAVALQVEDNVNAMQDAFRDILTRGDGLAAKRGALTEAEREQLGKLREEMQHVLNGLEGAWVSTQAQVLARLGTLSEVEWAALAASIGLTPTSRATLTKVVDVQDRPIFFLDSNRAFCLHGGACFDAVFAFFDDLARNDASLRDRYGKCIAGWMESEIERQMRRLFPAANVIRSACFSDPDNSGGETEADVVVLWGPFLIVVEAKGKRVAREALRGSQAKLKQTLSKNIQDAFLQSRRVLRVLERDGRIRFKEKATGRFVAIEKDKLRRVMPVSVTLQHLSGIPTQLAVTQKLGLFKGNAYPWSVSLDDLDVITRFSGWPDLFLHYIERRTAHQTSDVRFHGDELDIFGQYFQNRLHPSVYEGRKEIAEHSGPRMISVSCGEEAFEPFYAAELDGQARPNPAIDFKVPPEIRAVLDELRNRSDDGARWIAFALLSLSDGALARVAQAMTNLRTSLAEGRRILRTTMREDDVVINVMAHRGLTESDFFKNITVRTRLEHSRAKLRATVSIGIDQRDATKPFKVAQWLEGIWEHNPEIEKLLTEDSEQARTIQVPRGAEKPGRNAHCPCGSGKKFKKCCLGRITFQRVDSRGTFRANP